VIYRVNKNSNVRVVLALGNGYSSCYKSVGSRRNCSSKSFLEVVVKVWIVYVVVLKYVVHM
jgi:hypothetical protein